jgi:hypothetical protein
MKTKLFTLFLLPCLFLLNYQGIAQEKVAIKYFQFYRGDGILAYNFFVGPDAGSFHTSAKGFGSGVIDYFAGRNGFDIVDIGTEKFFVSVGAGLAILKYRFSNNLIFSQSENDMTRGIADPDITHNYVNTFSGYGKSKLVTTSIYFPVDLNLVIGNNLTFIAGGYLDLNISARYKMKYLVGEDKVKEIIRSAEFRNFNPSTTKFGINAALYHKKWPIGISASYCFTPFFKPGNGPDIHEARIAATYTLKSLKEVFRKKQQ